MKISRMKNHESNPVSEVIYMWFMFVSNKIWLCKYYLKSFPHLQHESEMQIHEKHTFSNLHNTKQWSISLYTLNYHQYHLDHNLLLNGKPNKKKKSIYQVILNFEVLKSVTKYWMYFCRDICGYLSKFCYLSKNNFLPNLYVGKKEKTVAPKYRITQYQKVISILIFFLFSSQKGKKYICVKLFQLNYKSLTLRDLGYFLYTYNWICTHRYGIYATYISGEGKSDNPEFSSVLGNMH